MITIWQLCISWATHQLAVRTLNCPKRLTRKNLRTHRALIFPRKPTNGIEIWILIRLAINNRRHPVSRLDSVKLATEAFQEVARQISAGRIATGEQKTPKVPIRDRRNDNWNVRGLLQVDKLSIVEKEMKDHNIIINITTYLVLARHTCEAVAISKLAQEIHCTSRETKTRAGVSVLMPSHD